MRAKDTVLLAIIIATVGMPRLGCLSYHYQLIKRFLWSSEKPTVKRRINSYPVLTFNYMHNLILSNVGKHISLEEDEQKYFISLLSSSSIAKREFVLQAGQPCKTICFVNAGLLRAYFLNKEGKESTVMFAMADWWITDMFCFINQQPAMISIQAVKDSQIFQLQKSQLEQLYDDVPKFERFFRVIMQNAYIREQLRVIQNLSLSAEERYYNFLKSYPQVAQHITQKQIASYLGITPEFLSTLRKNRGGLIS